MTSDVDKLIDRWVYDIRSRLWSRIESLKEDLDSEDSTVQTAADQEISLLLTWLLPIKSPEQRETSRRVREDEIFAQLKRSGFSDKQSHSIGVMLSRRGRRGRPMTARYNAVQAFYLHLASGMSWRQIAEQINGPCSHKCLECGDVLRDAPANLGGLKQRRPKDRCRKCRCTIRPVGRRERVCCRCADAIRAAVGELKVILKERDLLPAPL